MKAAPVESRIAYTATRRRLGRAVGEGGGKGGGAGGIEAPNTLQSQAIVGVIDLLSEGPIGGLVAGGKSIYFNNVPLVNNGGGYNFLGVTWKIMLGESDQLPVPGFPAVDNAVQLGEQILHNAPVTYTVTNINCTRASVIIEIPALFNTDTHNGNINPTSVEITIDVQDAEGNRVQVVDDVISGKCDSTYQRGYTFPLDGAGPWAIIVTRDTPDSQLTTLQNQTYLAVVDEIIDHPMGYPNSAYVALTFNSYYFGSTIPVRSYDIQGLLVQIPANYDPVARTYATSGTGTSGGTWDGVTMVAAVTDNPCWIAYDLVSNQRYGMALAASVLSATKWDLYQIGQYCDEMVPDGYGGMEPRFTCNVCLTTRDDAYTVLQTLVAIWRGMSYWGSGTLRFTADMPGPVVQLVTNADVIDGNFVYEGTALNARHTSALVYFTDPQQYWQPVPIVYQDPNLLVSSVIGSNPLEVNAVGATTAGQALRQAKWLIEAEDACTETVTYTAGQDHNAVRPGQIIAVADKAYQGISMGGRMLGVSLITIGGEPGYAIQLDRGVQQQAGAEYTFSCALIDGTVAQALAINSFVQNDDGTTTIQVLAPQAPMEAGAIWIVTSSTLAPRQFRVISAVPPQRGQWEITALLHDPNLYEMVEYDIQLPTGPFSTLPNQPSDPIGAPSNISIQDYYVGEGTTTVLRTTISWSAPIDARVTSYNLSITGDNGFSANYTGLAGPSYDVDNLPSGANYVFGLQSATASGSYSVWVYSESTLINGSPVAPPAPEGLTAIGGINSVQLAWESVAVFNLYYYQIQRAPVVGGVTGTFSLLTQTLSTSYTDSDSSVLLPNTQWAYEVCAVTTTELAGPYAGPVTATIQQVGTNNLAPGAVGTFATAELTNAIDGTGVNATPVQILSLAVTIPVLAGGASQTQNGLLLLTLNQGLDGGETEGGNQGWGVTITQDGNTLFSRTTPGYLDFPTIARAVSVSTPGSTFLVTWTGDVGVSLGTRDISLLGLAQ